MFTAEQTCPFCNFINRVVGLKSATEIFEPNPSNNVVCCGCGDTFAAREDGQPTFTLEPGCPYCHGRLHRIRDGYTKAFGLVTVYCPDCEERFDSFFAGDEAVPDRAEAILLQVPIER